MIFVASTETNCSCTPTQLNCSSRSSLVIAGTHALSVKSKRTRVHTQTFSLKARAVSTAYCYSVHTRARTHTQPFILVITTLPPAITTIAGPVQNSKPLVKRGGQCPPRAGGRTERGYSTCLCLRTGDKKAHNAPTARPLNLT